jgi:hypothetical protein
LVPVRFHSDCPSIRLPLIRPRRDVLLNVRIQRSLCTSSTLRAR